MPPRFLTLFVLAASLTLAQTVPPPMPATVIHDADLEYSNVGGRMAMDIVRPARPPATALPAVLLIHGGGFRAGNRQSYLPTAIKLAERGYVAATMSYRLSPRHQFPAAVEDAKAAVRFLRANATRYGIDPDHIGTMGGSAGGTLVLFLGVTPDVAEFEGSGPNRQYSSRVQCVVDQYGAADFTQSYSKSGDAAIVLPMFLGGDLDHNRAIHQRASPLNWVTPNAAPVLAIHGTNDNYVAYEQSVWMVERLIAAGVPAELQTIPGAGHGFRGADAEKAEQLTFEYFDRMLKNRPTQQTILISDHGPKGEIVAMEWPGGRTLWTKPNASGHDVQSLPNGHVLFTLNPKKLVVELNEKHEEVWSYNEGLEHPIAAQRLSNGNTLISDAKLGKVIEISPEKKIVWTYASPDLANMRSRNAHRTAEGTTLIAIEAEAKLIEVDPAGKIVWQWQANDSKNRKLYMGRRLDNGNTLISLSAPGELVEVDKSGRIVRTVGGMSNEIRMGWTSGFAQLPNGNLLMSDYTGRRLLEVDPKGKVVNELRMGPRTIASVDVVR